MVTYGATRAGQFHDWVQDNHPDAFEEWLGHFHLIDLDEFLQSEYWEILEEWYKTPD